MARTAANVVNANPRGDDRYTLAFGAMVERRYGDEAPISAGGLGRPQGDL